MCWKVFPDLPFSKTILQKGIFATFAPFHKARAIWSVLDQAHCSVLLLFCFFDEVAYYQDFNNDARLKMMLGFNNDARLKIEIYFEH